MTDDPKPKTPVASKKKLFVCHIGPIPGPSGEFTLYLPLAEGESFEPIEAPSAEEGLKRIAEAHPGYELTCAPELESAGASKGYAKVPYSGSDARNAANAAVGIALKRKLDEGIRPLELMTFLERASNFWNAPARTTWPSSKLLSVAVGATSGDKVQEEYECLLAAESRSEVVLLHEPGTAQTLVEHWSDEDEDEPDELGRDGVRFEKPEPYAVEALKRAWGLDVLPTPYSSKGGSDALVGRRVLNTIGGVLSAFAWLDPDFPAQKFKRQLADAAGGRYVVQVSPGERSPHRSSRSATHHCMAMKTFWFHTVNEGFYLIPDDVEPPPGELEIRTLTGKRRVVDAEAVKQWATDIQGASEHLARVARAGIERVQAELEASWRGGESGEASGEPKQASEGEAAGDASGKVSETAAEQAEAIARIIESASSAAAAALRKLSRKLRDDEEHDSGVQPKPERDDS